MLCASSIKSVRAFSPVHKSTTCASAILYLSATFLKRTEAVKFKTEAVVKEEVPN